MYRAPLNGMWRGSNPVSLLRPLAGVMLLSVSGITAVQAGDLEFKKTYSNVVDSPIGLGGASNLAISPDNRHIYVAAATDAGIGLFKRDTNGQPSYIGFHLAADDLGSSHLPLKVIVTADGANLYVALSPLDNKEKPKVALYVRDPGSGELTFKKSYEAPDKASDLAISSDGKSLYFSGKNSVSVFGRDTTTGELTPLETKSGVDGLADSAGLALTPDGKCLFVAGAVDNAVAVFSRDSSGRLSFVEALRNDPSKGVTGLSGASSVALSPDGINLYVAGTTDNALAVFKRNSDNCKVSYLEAWTQAKVPQFNAITSVIASPNGSRVYVSFGASGTQSAIAIFSTEPDSRKLKFIEVQSTSSNGVLSMTPTPNGAYLYAAAPADNGGKVSVFRTANSAPTPADDMVKLIPGENITLHVLANDTDPDNDVLHLAGADGSSTQGGTVVLNDDGTITYTAPQGFQGNDSFSYRVSDVRDAEPVVAQVNVTVKPVSTETPVDTGGGVSSSSGGGSGAMDGWFGMLLLSAVAIRRRVARRYIQ